VELAVELAQLPLDVDLAREGEVALEADRLAPPHSGVADRDEHGEVFVAAGEQRCPLGEQQDLERGRRGVLGARSSLRPVRRPRLRGLSAGLYGISGGLVVAASPRIVPSRVRADRAVRGLIPSLAGSAFSHRVIASVVREFSALSPQAGQINRRIM
jgi:hypothetical protein